MFPWEDIRLSDMIFYFLLYCDGNVGAAGEKKLGDPYMSSAEAFIEFWCTGEYYKLTLCNATRLWRLTFLHVFLNPD